ncbi:MAG: DNA-processing protein DprA [Bacteroidales bacterium]|jgi:DNA processing protein|nr:DNA-processing protein DprA [Bacteroidales bacterium]
MSLVHQIALTMLPGIGDINAKKLIAACGSPEAVFTEKTRLLMRIPGIGESTARLVNIDSIMDRVYEEIEFIQKYKIQTFFYTENAYPYRLKQCADGPILIYFKGQTDLNVPLIISIVGSRKATEYGKDFVKSIAEKLAGKGVLVVSGLAFGIDSIAHSASLDNGIATVGVMGHGLDRVYPSQNRSLAKRMLDQGGILSEFPSQTTPDRENFPKRNRIIAGLADACLVIETGLKGGSLITADIANSYNRDVYALPGRIGDPLSEGCNWLIKTNRAGLIESAEDLLESMGWNLNEGIGQRYQPLLFPELKPEEKQIFDLLKEHITLPIDEICMLSQMAPSRIAAALLNLEFEGLVKCMPGKSYRMVQR